jgi:hypothetical protein
MRTSTLATLAACWLTACAVDDSDPAAIDHFVAEHEQALDISIPWLPPLGIPPVVTSPTGPITTLCPTRKRPAILPGYTAPAIDPTTCIDRTAKVATIRVKDLPPTIRDELVANGLPAATSMLLYVPAADASGKRVAKLEEYGSGYKAGTP